MEAAIDELHKIIIVSGDEATKPQFLTLYGMFKEKARLLHKEAPVRELDLQAARMKVEDLRRKVPKR